MHWGLDGRTDCTLEEIGEHFDVSDHTNAGGPRAYSRGHTVKGLGHTVSDDTISRGV